MMRRGNRRTGLIDIFPSLVRLESFPSMNISSLFMRRQVGGIKVYLALENHRNPPGVPFPPPKKCQNIDDDKR